MKLKTSLRKSFQGSYGYRVSDHKWEKHLLKDTHRESTPPNKTQAVTESINTDIWITGTVNQLFIRACYTKIIFYKK